MVCSSSSLTFACISVITWTMLLMLTLSLYGAPRRFMSCNVPAAHFFRYVISNLVFEILFSTRAKSTRLADMPMAATSPRLADMPMAATSPRLNTQGLSIVVRNFCRGKVNTIGRHADGYHIATIGRHADGYHIATTEHTGTVHCGPQLLSGAIVFRHKLPLAWSCSGRWWQQGHREW